jgi:CMP-N,N'-diacetyllegionaminic acid synthase
MERYLAIIPARAGSKGIKNKNIVPLCGKPLLAYTVAPALALREERIIDEVIVSTDSRRIAQIARGLGASVPFLRPQSISGDTAPSVDLVLHALGYYETIGRSFGAVVLLQPTSPLRDYQDIKNAISVFDSLRAESLISCYMEETISDLIMYSKDHDFAIPLNPNHNKGVRRQDHEPVCIRNGAIYIVRVDYVKASRQVVSDKPLMYLMPKSRSNNLDTASDLELLEKMICG